MTILRLQMESRRPLSLLAVVLALAVPHVAAGQSTATVHRTTLGEAGQATPDVSTEEVVRILASGSEEVDLVRQRYPDKATRLVFAETPDAARKVAEEIAGKAYWNSSYFGGTFAELSAAKLW